MNNFFGFVFLVYYYMVLVYIILSWIPELKSNSLYQTLAEFVEPYLGLFRHRIFQIGLLDFSAIVALLFLFFLRSIII